jgi:hypothetical protein
MKLEDAIKQAQQRINYGDEVLLSISPDGVFVIATWHSKHWVDQADRYRMETLNGEDMTLAEQVIEATQIIQEDDE